ncbi:MAG: Dabb family protein [Candidatus Mycalebacterium zealandia]|nr:MAG: Dabb family protein [Candidatus Mycalebacterium zealandia]
MLKHIVMWRLKDAEKNAPVLKKMLEGLAEKIPQIVKIEAGVNFNPSENSADVVLYSEFENSDALAAYQKHPDHLKVAEFLKEKATDRRVVDYED